MSLIYGEYLVNVPFGDIPHTFIPHITLHAAEKISIEFSTNYPLTTVRIPQSAFCKIALPVPSCLQWNEQLSPDRYSITTTGFRILLVTEIV